MLLGFRENKQESVVFRLYEDSKLRREEDEEEGRKQLKTKPYYIISN